VETVDDEYFWLIGAGSDDEYFWLIGAGSAGLTWAVIGPLPKYIVVYVGGNTHKPVSKTIFSFTRGLCHNLVIVAFTHNDTKQSEYICSMQIYQLSLG